MNVEFAMRGRRALLALSALAALGVAPLATAQQVLRVTTIPEEAATEQVRNFGPCSCAWSAWDPPPACWRSR